MNDLIVGCRTIKCYGWEKHYIDRIGDLRRRSFPHAFCMDLIMSMGTSLFQNIGTVAILIIILCEWGNGQQLETEVIMSALAMVYVLFFQVNTTAYYGLNNLYAFLAILQRLASVLALEECEYKKDTQVAKEDVTIELNNASYGWGFRISEDQTQAKRGKQITESEERVVIADLDVKLAHDDLLVVVGMVGCGKTTLLHTIMGETK